MGIPVWEFRTQATEAVSDVTLSPETIEKITRCQWFFIVDLQHYKENEQRLLQAMLFAVGLDFEHIALLSPEQFKVAEQGESLAKRKVVFILGKLLLNQDNVPYQSDNEKLSAITSFSLTELLNKPENKAQVWQDLKLAKVTIQS